MDYLLKNQSDIAKMNYINLPGTTTDIYGPSGFVDAGLGFQDKRNRNPNWTDHEINRFLEMLQEDDTVKDLVANRNKKVFCMIAQRMCTEGAEKTWDQCRIKLKNLKSQYRYVKERIPNIDDLDLEDDDVVRQLIAECQGRGISPSSIKHLRSLLRFLNKQKEFAKKSGSSVSSDFLNSSSVSVSHNSSSTSSTIIASPQPFVKRHHQPELSIKPSVSLSSTQILKIEEEKTIQNFEEDAVSPPSSPTPGLKIIPGQNLIRKRGRADIKMQMNAENTDFEDSFNEMHSETGVHVTKKKPYQVLLPSIKAKQHSAQLSNASKTKHNVSMPKQHTGRSTIQPTNESGLMENDYKFIERFNRDMMDQFMEHQRRTQASFTRWEQERWRQERETMERWRQEARDHERQLFSMFCSAMTKCNAALTSVMRARCKKQNKTSLIDNGLVVTNGSPNAKSGSYCNNIQEPKSFERIINSPKKRKLDSEHGGSHKTSRTSNEGVEVNSSPISLHGESDVHEQDSPCDGPYVNENSLDEAADGSFEENEKFFEKDDIDDEDRDD